MEMGGINKKAAAILLLLLAIMPLSFALVRGDLFRSGAADTRVASIVQIIIVGMALMIGVATLLYMASQAFRLPEVEAHVRTELYQLIITVIWCIAVFGCATILNGVISSYTQGGDMFDMADAYIGRVNCLATSTVIKLEGMKMGAQYLSGMMAKYYAGAWGFKVPMFPGFEVIERAIDIIQMLMTPFSASLMAQQIGLQIIKATALLFVLPSGLVLRLFPQTREAGSFLIATGLGFYFVFTFIYIINAQVFGQMYRTEFGHDICSGELAQGEEWLRDFKFYGQLGGQMMPITGGDITKTATYNPMALLDPLNALSYVAVQAVFMPAVAMTMVVSFIRTSGKFFSQNMG